MAIIVPPSSGRSLFRLTFVLLFLCQNLMKTQRLKRLNDIFGIVSVLSVLFSAKWGEKSPVVQLLLGHNQVKVRRTLSLSSPAAKGSSMPTPMCLRALELRKEWHRIRDPVAWQYSNIEVCLEIPLRTFELTTKASSCIQTWR